MLFGVFNCDDMGSYCAYSIGGDITEILEHLSEQTGYDVLAERVEWFQGIQRQLKPIRYEFQD